MLRKILFFFVLCFFALRTASGRQIDVCVLNDEASPVSDKLITDLLETASSEFGKHVGIVFREVERHRSKLDLFVPDSVELSQFRSSCAGGEIAAAFTNRIISARDWYSFVSPMPVGSVKGNLLGLGNPMGFIIIASAKYGASRRDASGRPRIYGTIKHELGHLFFAGHINDERSFLFPYGYGFPGWTPKTEEVIRNHASRTWMFKSLGRSSKATRQASTSQKVVSMPVPSR